MSKVLDQVTETVTNVTEILKDVAPFAKLAGIDITPYVAGLGGAITTATSIVENIQTRLDQGSLVLSTDDEGRLTAALNDIRQANADLNAYIIAS